MADAAPTTAADAAPTTAADDAPTTTADAAPAEAEFDHPKRIGILKDLGTHLEAHQKGYKIRPTAWACLWLGDIDALKEMVKLASSNPSQVIKNFDKIENSVKPVQACEFTNLIL